MGRGSYRRVRASQLRASKDVRSRAAVEGLHGRDGASGAASYHSVASRTERLGNELGIAPKARGFRNDRQEDGKVHWS